ncbi:MAG: cell division protein FtsB [Thiohalomonadaceae bacterium]
MRMFAALLLVVLLLLQYRLWFGDGSLIKVWQLKQAITRQQDENHQLTERNRALEAEVRDLKEGVAAIEERARTELGMIRDGETFYQVVEE